MRHPFTAPVSTANKIQRRNQVWAGPRVGEGGLIQIQYLQQIIHGTEAEYSSKIAIEFDGSIINGTTDLIEISRNLYHREVNPSLRS